MVTDMSTSDGRFKELSPCSRLANKSDGFEYQEILELEQVSPPRSLRSIGYLRMALTAGSMRGGGGFFATKLTRPVITTGSLLLWVNFLWPILSCSPSFELMEEGGLKQEGNYTPLVQSDYIKSEPVQILLGSVWATAPDGTGNSGKLPNEFLLKNRWPNVPFLVVKNADRPYFEVYDITHGRTSVQCASEASEVGYKIIGYEVSGWMLMSNMRFSHFHFTHICSLDRVDLPTIEGWETMNMDTIGTFSSTPDSALCRTALVCSQVAGVKILHHMIDGGWSSHVVNLEHWVMSNIGAVALYRNRLYLVNPAALRVYVIGITGDEIFSAQALLEIDNGPGILELIDGEEEDGAEIDEEGVEDENEENDEEEGGEDENEENDDEEDGEDEIEDEGGEDEIEENDDEEGGEDENEENNDDEENGLPTSMFFVDEGTRLLLVLSGEDWGPDVLEVFPDGSNNTMNEWRGTVYGIHRSAGIMVRGENPVDPEVELEFVMPRVDGKRYIIAGNSGIHIECMEFFFAGGFDFQLRPIKSCTSGDCFCSFSYLRPVAGLSDAVPANCRRY